MRCTPAPGLDDGQGESAASERTRHLGLGPGFAVLSRGDLRLLLNAAGAGGAGQAAIDGRLPEPGGWSRFQLELDDLDTTVTALTAAGCTFRTGVIQGNGGRQALVEDPSGNLVELFEPV